MVDKEHEKRENLLNLIHQKEKIEEQDEKYSPITTRHPSTSSFLWKPVHSDTHSGFELFNFEVLKCGTKLL